MKKGLTKKFIAFVAVLVCTLGCVSALALSGVSIPQLMSEKPTAQNAVGADGDEANPFTITGGTLGTDYSIDQVSKSLNIISDQAMTIANIDYSTAASYRISAVTDANITLAGVKIRQSSPFLMSEGVNVSLSLARGSKNILTSPLGASSPGLNTGGVNSSLTIQATTPGDNEGSLEVTPSESSAGIGGSNNVAAGNITIASGIVKAYGDGGAAIGGGPNASGSNITISGGTVEAYASGRGSAIGGGAGGDGSGITIRGGNVTATANNTTAACIGGGGSFNGKVGNSSDINILGGNITTISSGSSTGSCIGAGAGGQSTGTVINGNVVLTATRAVGTDFFPGCTPSQGLVFTATGTSGSGTLYGNVEVGQDATFPYSFTFGATAVQTLTIAADVTVNCPNAIDITNGLYGTLDMKDGAKFTGSGAIKTKVAYDIGSQTPAIDAGTYTYKKIPTASASTCTYTDDSEGIGNALPDMSAYPDFSAWWSDSGHTSFVGGSTPVALNIHTLYGDFSGALPWMSYDEATTTFTLSYGPRPDGDSNHVYPVNATGYANVTPPYALKWGSQATQVVIDASVDNSQGKGWAPTDISSIFHGLTSVENIKNLPYLDVSKVTKMIYLFYGNSALESLDLTGWDIISIAAANKMSMFGGLNSLKELTVSNTFEFENMTSFDFGSATKFWTCSIKEMMPYSNHPYFYWDDYISRHETSTFKTATETLTFNLNGGTVDGKTDNVFLYGNPTEAIAEEDLYEPTLTGTEFLGWAVKGSTDIVDITEFPASNTEYVAQWYPFKVTGGTSGTDYSFDVTNKKLNILTATALTIENVNPDAPTDWNITTPNNSNANLTLAGVNISRTSSAASFNAQGSYSTSVTLKEGTTNTFISSSAGNSAINKGGTGVLEITGTGSLITQAGAASGISGSNIHLKGGIIKATATENSCFAVGSLGASGNEISGNVILEATAAEGASSAISGFAESGLRQGIVYSRIGSAGSWTGAMYGSVSLPASYTLPASLTFGQTAAQTLTIPAQTKLTVPANVVLTVGKSGTFTQNAGAQIDIVGTLKTTVAFDIGGVATSPSDMDYPYLVNNRFQTYGTLPSVTGFTVEGWFKEAAHTNEVKADTNVSVNDHTLYAKIADTAWMKYTSSDTTLTMTYGQKPEGTIDEDVWHVVTYTNTTPWATKVGNSATTVAIDESVKNYAPATTAFYFANLSKVNAFTGLSNLNLVSVSSSMVKMFYGCSSLTELELPDSFNTSRVVYMNSLFEGCSSLKSLVLPSSFNSALLQQTEKMFSGCTSLESLTLPKDFTLSSVTNGASMFTGCSALKEITLPKNFTFPTGSSFNFGTAQKFWIVDINTAMQYTVAVWNEYLSKITTASETFTQASIDLTFKAGTNAHFNVTGSPTELHLYGDSGKVIPEGSVPEGVLEGAVFKGFTKDSSTEVIPPEDISTFPSANATYTASYVVIPFEVTGGDENDYAFDTDNLALIIKSGQKELTIKNVDPDHAVKNWQIKTEANQDTKLILAGLDIETDENSAKTPFALTSSANVTLKLLADTTNTFVSNASGYAGIQKDDQNAELSIVATGTGTNVGILSARGGNEAPGIGSSATTTQNITIASGDVSATGGDYAAGIGSARNLSASNIEISGGTVSATGGKGAAGIGTGQNNSGSSVSASQIKLSGGIIHANAGDADSASNLVAAGIGGGGSATASANELNGNCVVYATSGSNTKEALEGFDAQSGLLQGIAFTQKGPQASQVGAMYGSVTLPGDVIFSADLTYGEDADSSQTLTVPKDTKLTIDPSATLTLGKGATLTQIQGSTLEVLGKIDTVVSFDVGGIVATPPADHTFTYRNGTAQGQYGNNFPTLPPFIITGWTTGSDQQVTASSNVVLNEHTLYASVADTSWMSYAEGTLTLSYGQKPEGAIDEEVWHVDVATPLTTVAPWTQKHASDITSFVVADSVSSNFKPTSLAYWFYNLSKLGEVNFGTLDTSALVSTQSLFASCTSLTQLSLPSGFKITSNGNVSSMFEGCSALETLSLGNSFVVGRDASATSMFSGCDALASLTLPKGFYFSDAMGFNFGSDEMFWISSVTEQMPYGEGALQAWNNTLAALREPSLTVTTADCVLSFDPNGGTFNGSTTPVKRYGKKNTALAGANVPQPTKDGSNFIGYNTDTSATSGVTPAFGNDAETTYYALWGQGAYMSYNAGTLTLTYGAQPGGSDVWEIDSSGYSAQTPWATKFGSSITNVVISLSDEVKDVYKPTSIAWWFSGLSKLSHISGLDSLNTSNLGYTQHAFEGCSVLSTLDLPAHFDTDSVTDMSSMFSGCSSLTSLSLPEAFKADSLQNMNNMFSGCSALQTLSFSKGFKPLAAATMTGAFSGCDALTAVTFAKGFAFDADSGFNFGSNASFWVASQIRQMAYSGDAIVSDWNDYLANMEGDTHTFTKANVVLSFSANGGKFGDAETVNFYGSFGQVVDTSLVAPERESYDFVGYNTSATATTGVPSITFPASTPSTTPAYYAIWSQSAYMRLVGTTLTLSFGSLPEGGSLGTDTWKVDAAYTGAPAWVALADSIEAFSVSGTSQSLAAYKPASMAWWFSGLSKLSSISGLDKLDLSALQDTSHMFSGCAALSSLSLPATFLPTTSADMFSGCDALSTLTLGKGFTMAANSGLLFGTDSRFWIATDTRQMVFSDTSAAAADWTNYLANITDTTHTFVVAHVALTFNAGEGHFGDVATNKVTYLYGDAGQTIAEGKIESPTRDNFDFSGYSITGALPAADIKVFPASSATYKAIWTQSAYMKVASNTLTLSFGAEPSGTIGTDVWKVEDAYTAAPGWSSQASAINTFALDSSVGAAAYKPTSVAWWFSGLSALSDVSAIANLDLSAVGDASSMFSGCSALTALSLPAGFAPTATDNMFNGTSGLTEITLPTAFRFGANTGFNFNKTSPFWVGSMKDKLETTYTAWNTYLASLTTETTHRFYEASLTITFYANGGYFGQPGVEESKLYGNAGDPISSNLIPIATLEGATSKSYTSTEQGGDIETPTAFGDSDDIYWALWTQAPYAKLAGGTLTISFGAKPTPDAGSEVWKVEDAYSASLLPAWTGDAYKDSIVQVTIGNSVKEKQYAPTSMAYWFSGLSKLKRIDNLSNLDTASVRDMTNLFYGCSDLSSLDLTQFKTDQVAHFDNMFSGCSKLSALDVSQFETQAAQSMSSMFEGLSVNAITLSSQFVTQNVTNMSALFKGCSALTTLDLSSFTTTSSTNMSEMFSGCTGLTSITLSKSFIFNSGTGFSFTRSGNAFWVASQVRKMATGSEADSVADWNVYLGALEVNKPHTFTLASVTLTFFAGDGSFGEGTGTSDEAFLYGNADEDIEEVPTPVRDDYDFSGYSETDGGTTPVELKKFGTSDDNYYAIWTQSPYMSLLGSTLTLTYGQKPAGDNSWKVESSYTAAPAWASKANEITTFAVDTSVPTSFAPTSMAWWFANLNRLSDVSALSKVTLTNVADAQSMFSGCSALATLSLPAGFKPSQTDNMFSGDTALETITLGKDFAFGANSGFVFTSDAHGFWIASISEKINETASDWNTYLAGLKPGTTHTFVRANVTLTFYAKDGQFGEDSPAKKEAYLYGKANQTIATEDLPRPTRAGYNFKGYATTQTGTETVTVDKFPAGDAEYWALYGQGAYMSYSEGTLTFSFGAEPSDVPQEDIWTVDAAGYSARTPWATKYGSSITSFVVDNSIQAAGYKPQTLAYFFDGLSAITTFSTSDLEKIDTSALTNTSHMFSDCTSLTSLTLPENFKIAQAGNTSAMFSGCSALTTLSLSKGFVLASSATSQDMFLGTGALTSITLPKNFTFTGDMNFNFGDANSFWIASPRRPMSYAPTFAVTDWNSYLSSSDFTGETHEFTKATIKLTFNAGDGAHFGDNLARVGFLMCGNPGDPIDAVTYLEAPIKDGYQFLYYKNDVTGARFDLTKFPASDESYTAVFEQIAFTVDGGERGTDYVLDGENKKLKVLTNTPLTISNAAGRVVSWSIEVSAPAAKLSLNNVSTQVEGAPAMHILNGAGASLILKAGSVNSFVSKDQGFAGIQKDEGSGSLSIETEAGATPGTLNAAGGAGGSGIGGATGKSASNITISSGTVSATGETGIGGGAGGSGSSISLLGGSITTSGNAGAGIGGGSGNTSSASNVINGNCVVTATSGAANKSALEGFSAGFVKGIAFEKKGASGTFAGTMYGNEVTLSQNVKFVGDLVIGASSKQTLTVDSGVTVSLDAASTLTNGVQGTVELKEEAGAKGVISGGTVETVVAFSTKQGVPAPANQAFTYMQQGALQKYADLPELSASGFNGWYKGETGFDQANLVTDDSDVELNLHALRARFSYQVSFVMPEGTVTPPASVSVDDGGSVAEPSVTWSDGDIDGWYTSNTFSEASKWTFAGSGVTNPSTVSADTVLYAKCMCTVTYDANGGSDVPEASVLYGTVIGTEPSSVLAGKNLGGWYITDAGQEVRWNFGEDKVVKTMELKAHWVDNFTVTFVVPEGTVVAPTPASVAPNTPVAAPTVTWDKGTLAGWYTDRAFTQPWDFTIGVTEDMDLYAKFTCTVKFESDGGSYVAPKTVTFGESVTAPAQPTKQGASFDAWYLGTSSTPFDFSSAIKENTTLTARWLGAQAITVPAAPEHGTITLPETSALPGARVSFSAVPDAHYTLEATPSVVGASSGDAVDVSALGGNKFSFVMPKEAVSVSARFVGEMCTVTFDTQGGTPVDSASVSYGSPVARPANPTREGYSFNEWFTTPDGSVMWNFATTAVEGNTTIYAQWIGDPHTADVTPRQPGDHGDVTIKSPAADEIKTGSKVVLDIKPDPGYEVDEIHVKGKASGKEVEVGYDEKTGEYYYMQPNEDVDIKVTFKRIVLVVHFNLLNGEEPIDQNVYWGDRVVRPADPTREGYSFVDWFDSAGRVYDFEQEVKEGFTLDAHWLGNEQKVDLPTGGEGKVEIKPETPRTGDEVIIVITPDEGYEPDGPPVVTDEFGNVIPVRPTGNKNEYSYIQPNGKVSISVTYRLIAPVYGGWKSDSVGWWYELSDGSYYNNGWHFFDDEFGAHWYYFDSSGYIATSRWIWDNSWDGWYWVCSTGPMIENLWQWIGNDWYGFWWGGKMCTGWVWDTAYAAWYYCDTVNGHMYRNSWLYNAPNNSYYYFLDSGQMAKSQWVQRGWYYVNSMGVWNWQ